MREVMRWGDDTISHDPVHMHDITLDVVCLYGHPWLRLSP